MTSNRLILGLLFSAIYAGSASFATAADYVIKTNNPGGADAELREFQPTNKLGASTELATRQLQNNSAAVEALLGLTTDRSSIMLMRWNIRGLTPADAAAATDVIIRTTWRNANIAQSQETSVNNTNGRLRQTYDPPYTDPNGVVVTPNSTSKLDDNGDEIEETAGFNYYALNPGHPANSAAGKFIENPGNPQGVSYSNAPGILPDGDIGTFDVDPAQTVFLGNKKLPDIGTQNHLPVGGEFLFSSPALTAHLANAIAAGDWFVNVFVHLDFNLSNNANNTVGNTHLYNQLTNFNYLVNPKEQLTLINDPGYDTDVTDPNNPTGSPWSLASNANGDFSPQLIVQGALIPEPSTLALLGLVSLSGASLLRRRRN